jgi:hypothetical protein
VLYGYATGVFSSRKIQTRTYEDVAFRFLSADEHPDHSTLADFRNRQHGETSQLAGGDPPDAGEEPSLREQMKRKLGSAAGQDLYRRICPLGNGSKY